jgi:voltage-gated potassium channel
VLRRDAKIELIQSVPLFADCSKSELRRVAASADEVTLPSGYALTKEGATGRELVVIIDGAADVLQRGRKVAKLSSGDFLGEIALVSGIPRTATVVTTKPTRALVLTAQSFRGLIRSIPSMQFKVLEALASRLPAQT